MLDELYNTIVQHGYDCEWFWDLGDRLVVFLSDFYAVIFYPSEQEGLLDFIIDKKYPGKSTIEDLFIGTTKPDNVLEILNTMYNYAENRVDAERLTLDLMFKEYGDE